MFDSPVDARGQETRACSCRNEIRAILVAGTPGATGSSARDFKLRFPGFCQLPPPISDTPPLSFMQPRHLLGAGSERGRASPLQDRGLSWVGSPRLRIPPALAPAAARGLVTQTKGGKNPLSKISWAPPLGFLPMQPTGEGFAREIQTHLGTPRADPEPLAPP